MHEVQPAEAKLDALSLLLGQQLQQQVPRPLVP